MQRKEAAHISRRYAIIIDRPRWDKFPFIARKKHTFILEAEYYEVCDKYNTVKEMIADKPNWKISIDVATEDGGFRSL